MGSSTSYDSRRVRVSPGDSKDSSGSRSGPGSQIVPVPLDGNGGTTVESVSVDSSEWRSYLGLMVVFRVLKSPEVEVGRTGCTGETGYRSDHRPVNEKNDRSRPSSILTRLGDHGTDKKE